MKARYRYLIDHSINLGLAAIEIYNKPLFRDREQVFAILLTNAWESLLKAKILKDKGNRMSSLYVRRGPLRYKKNAMGQYITIDVLTAAKQCNLNTIAYENLERIVEIRNSAIHLTAESPSLPYLTFSLGLAGLRNFAKLLDEWFLITLEDYSFFILPLGFSYPFHAVTPMQLRKEPKDVAALLRQLKRSQESGKTESDGFHLAFEITTKLVSAKKLTGTAELTTAIDQNIKGAIIVEKRVRLVDLYPLSFYDLWGKIKAEIPNIRQGLVFAVIKDLRVKGDQRYSAYNWRNKAQEARGPQSATTVIYNEDAVNLILTECRNRLKKRS